MRADYAELLISALNQGHLQLGSDDKVRSPETAADKVMRSVEITADRDTMVQLTEAGGLVWERLAIPRWSGFVRSELTFQEPDPSNIWGSKHIQPKTSVSPRGP